MIFITVGTQAPFDRLIKFIDKWAELNKVECFAQIGETSFMPIFLAYKKFLSQQEFDYYFNMADLVISHAGMGTIIQCASNNKPILTLPRQAKFEEHRNNHQVSTTKAMAKMGFIHPIFNESELNSFLNKYSDLKPLKNIRNKASEELQRFIISIIDD